MTQTRSRANLLKLQIGAIAFAILLSACGTSNYNFHVAPGKYAQYDCILLGQTAGYFLAREKQSRELISRAQASDGGTFIAAIAYPSEESVVQGNLEELRREVTAKQCQPAPQGLIPQNSLPIR